MLSILFGEGGTCEDSITTRLITGRPIRVLVVDDHQMVAESFRRILDAEDDMEAVAVATTVADALEAALTHTPDVVLMDYVLPDGNGITATTGILARLPSTRIVLLTGSGAEDALPGALAAGCVGAVEKTAALTELAPAVRTAAATLS
jgi:DNA-binding NarL/FixJ family response regulator